MSFLVREPGLFSLLVDTGRPGTRSLGVPHGGAADRAAFTLGNALIGNFRNEPALEVTLAGPTLEAQQRCACVLFGAPFSLRLTGRPVASGTTFTLEPGEVLHIGGTPNAARAYLCVAGGFDAPLVLASRSALDPLKRGAVLRCPASRCEPRGLGFTSLDECSGSTSLRVLDGPQRDWFPDDRFFTQSFEVSAASNRMGLRLTGEPLSRTPGELTSEAVAPGAVQITNEGLPIVLGVDGQTIGGYPKIAHVIRADLDTLAQLRTGTSVQFVRVTQEEAEIASQRRRDEVRTWVNRLRSADRWPTLG